MATFTLTIETDNAAFEGANTFPEVARILRFAADKVEDGNIAGPLLDVNGNTVGSYGYDLDTDDR